MPQFSKEDHPDTPPGVDQSLEFLISSLQGMVGGDRGLGVWQRFPLSDLAWKTDVAGVTVTVPKNAGSLSIARIGRTGLISVDAFGVNLAVSGTCTQLWARLPDGYEFQTAYSPLGGSIADQQLTPGYNPLTARGGVVLCFRFVLPGGAVNVCSMILHKDAVVFTPLAGVTYIAGETYALFGQIYGELIRIGDIR